MKKRNMSGPCERLLSKINHLCRATFKCRDGKPLMVVRPTPNGQFQWSYTGADSTETGRIAVTTSPKAVPRMIYKDYLSIMKEAIDAFNESIKDFDSFQTMIEKNKTDGPYTGLIGPSNKYLLVFIETESENFPMLFGVALKFKDEEDDHLFVMPLTNRVDVATLTPERLKEFCETAAKMFKVKENLFIEKYGALFPERNKKASARPAIPEDIPHELHATPFGNDSFNLETGEVVKCSEVVAENVKMDPEDESQQRRLTETPWMVEPDNDEKLPPPPESIEIPNTPNVHTESDGNQTAIAEAVGDWQERCQEAVPKSDPITVKTDPTHSYLVYTKTEDGGEVKFLNSVDTITMDPNDKLIDLTQYYGSGNEPKEEGEVAELLKEIAPQPMDYNAAR